MGHSELTTTRSSERHRNINTVMPRTSQPWITLLSSVLVNSSAFTALNFMFYLAQSDHYSPRRWVMCCWDLCREEEGASWDFCYIYLVNNRDRNGTKIYCFQTLDVFQKVHILYSFSSCLSFCHLFYDLLLDSLPLIITVYQEILSYFLIEDMYEVRSLLHTLLMLKR